MKIWINISKCSHINNAPPAKALPKARNDVDGNERFRIAHRGRAVEPEGHEHFGDGTGFGPEQDKEDADQDNRRDEVGGVHDDLDRFLGPFEANLVQEQGVKNRECGIENDAKNRKDKGVLHERPEVRRSHESVKMLETAHLGPGGIPDALERVVILEGNDEPFQRKIMENEDVDDGREGHQKERDSPFGPKASRLRFANQIAFAQICACVGHIDWKRFHYRKGFGAKRIN